MSGGSGSRRAAGAASVRNVPRMSAPNAGAGSTFPQRRDEDAKNRLGYFSLAAPTSGGGAGGHPRGYSAGGGSAGGSSRLSSTSRGSTSAGESSRGPSAAGGSIGGSSRAASAANPSFTYLGAASLRDRRRKAGLRDAGTFSEDDSCEIAPASAQATKEEQFAALLLKHAPGIVKHANAEGRRKSSRSNGDSTSRGILSSIMAYYAHGFIGGCQKGYSSGKVSNERDNPFLAALYHCWPDASRILKFAGVL
ncbi:unnamed protein product [Scytosiphon promiscuus]